MTIGATPSQTVGPYFKIGFDRLANAEALAEYAQQALTLLDEGSPESSAASDLIGQAAQSLAGLAKIDPAQDELSNQASLLEDTISDLVRDLRDYLDEIEFNPKRLEDVEERLDLIHRLSRKYGGSIPAVTEYVYGAVPPLAETVAPRER